MTSLFPQFARFVCSSLVFLLIGWTNASARDAENLSKLLGLIRTIEAPAGYDDFYRGVPSPPPAALTSMTVGDVLAWQDQIDPHSISEASGGYQFMEDTLRDLVHRFSVEPTELFSPQLQDFLATQLLNQIGWGAFRRQEISARTFGDRLAGIWAGLPLLTGQRRGFSAYHGVAGNRALITADDFESALTDLSRFDLASFVASRSRNPPPPTAVSVRHSEPSFEPSVVITWASDPFYQE